MESHVNVPDAPVVEPLLPAAPAPDALPAVPGGGVVSARGFRAAGVHAGFRADPERLDLALVAADEPCAAAAVFTRNVFCAAPVQVDREKLDEGGRGGELRRGQRGHRRAGPRGRPRHGRHHG